DRGARQDARLVCSRENQSQRRDEKGRDKCDLHCGTSTPERKSNLATFALAVRGLQRSPEIRCVPLLRAKRTLTPRLLDQGPTRFRTRRVRYPTVESANGGGRKIKIKGVSKMRIYILAAVAAAGIGLGGTFGASAVPISGNLVGASAAPELHKVYYYNRHARRHYRRAYRRGDYGGYYGGYKPGYYGGYNSGYQSSLDSY